MSKPTTKTEIINGQLVTIKVYPPKRPTYKQWTAKSKNYLLNGMPPK